MDDLIKKKNCVILHSKKHFNPDCDSDLDESSAGRVARQIYRAAIEKDTHNIYYYDLFDTTEWVKMPVDILISLVDNRNLANWFFKPEKSYVIAVNRHPLDRLALIDEAIKGDIPVDALTDSDGFLQSYRKLPSATEIACVGNEYVATSYRKNLVSLKVTNSYYDSNFFGGSHTSKRSAESKELRVLVLASSIGFRKGADLLIDLAEICRDDNLIFDVIGVPEVEYWRSRLEGASKDNRNLVLHGWINNKSLEFQNYLSSANVAIFLSREEGLLGSLIECINKGIPSLHGIQSGLNPSDEILDISHLNVLQIRSQLKAFLKLTHQEQKFLGNKQKNFMVHQFQQWESLHDVISRWMDSPRASHQKRYRLYPVSVGALKNLKSVFRRRRYWRIYLFRIKTLFIRYQLDKLSICSPNTFKVLKSIKMLFSRS